jgi:hypothetical protein
VIAGHRSYFGAGLAANGTYDVVNAVLSASRLDVSLGSVSYPFVSNSRIDDIIGICYVGAVDRDFITSGGCTSVVLDPAGSGTAGSRSLNFNREVVSVLTASSVFIVVVYRATNRAGYLPDLICSTGLLAYNLIVGKIPCVSSKVAGLVNGNYLGCLASIKGTVNGAFTILGTGGKLVGVKNYFAPGVDNVRIFVLGLGSATNGTGVINLTCLGVLYASAPSMLLGIVYLVKRRTNSCSVLVVNVTVFLEITVSNTSCRNVLNCNIVAVALVDVVDKSSVTYGTLILGVSGLTALSRNYLNYYFNTVSLGMNLARTGTCSCRVGSKDGKHTGYTHYNCD